MASYDREPVNRLLGFLEGLGAGRLSRSAARKLIRRQRRLAQRDYARALAALTPADLCLDLGANVGEETLRMAATGATVHAFEPDPHTFATLAKNVAGLPNVHLHQAAVGARSGTVRLYRRQGWQERPNRLVSSSVVFDDPDRMDHANAVDVEQRAFADVLRDLGPFRLVKMDIEGAEVDILEAVLPTGLPGFDTMYVETHERHRAGDGEKVERFRREAAALASQDINLFWH